jgi:hypothetical protein
MPRKEIWLWPSVEYKLHSTFQYTQPAKICKGALQFFYGGTSGSKIFGSASFPFHF